MWPALLKGLEVLNSLLRLANCSISNKLNNQNEREMFPFPYKVIASLNIERETLYSPLWL